MPPLSAFIRVRSIAAAPPDAPSERARLNTARRDTSLPRPPRRTTMRPLIALVFALAALPAAAARLSAAARAPRHPRRHVRERARRGPGAVVRRGQAAGGGRGRAHALVPRRPGGARAGRARLLAEQAARAGDAGAAPPRPR